MTLAEDILNKNYYKKGPQEDFKVGQVYYFLNPDKSQTIKATCNDINMSGACGFKIDGTNTKIYKDPSKTEAWWRHGNPFGIGSASEYQPKDIDSKINSIRQRQRTQRQRSQRKRSQRKRQRSQRR
jgi:hypothetical protein